MQFVDEELKVTEVNRCVFNLHWDRVGHDNDFAINWGQ